MPCIDYDACYTLVELSVITGLPYRAARTLLVENPDIPHFRFGDSNRYLIKKGGFFRWYANKRKTANICASGHPVDHMGVKAAREEWLAQYYVDTSPQDEKGEGENEQIRTKTHQKAEARVSAQIAAGNHEAADPERHHGEGS